VTEWEVFAGGRLHKITAYLVKIERGGTIAFYDSDGLIQQAFREWGRCTRIS
jgi:hypothetical protein